MSDNLSAYTEVGSLLAAVLENPHSPAGVREAVVAHIDGLLTRANLMRPDVVRAIYPYLIAADISQAAQKGAGTSADAAEAEAVATELAAEAAPAAEAVEAAAAEAETGAGARDSTGDGGDAAMGASAE